MIRKNMPDMLWISAMEEAEIYEVLNTSPEGLSEAQTEELREQYGENRITRGKKLSLA